MLVLPVCIRSDVGSIKNLLFYLNQNFSWAVVWWQSYGNTCHCSNFCSHRILYRTLSGFTDLWCTGKKLFIIGSSNAKLVHDSHGRFIKFLWNKLCLLLLLANTYKIGEPISASESEWVFIYHPPNKTKKYSI